MTPAKLVDPQQRRRGRRRTIVSVAAPSPNVAKKTTTRQSYQSWTVLLLLSTILILSPTSASSAANITKTTPPTPKEPTHTANVPRPPLPGMHPTYPYENVVFQGGGAKGLIYCGVTMAMEELGILPHLKRFGGASIGSAVALMFALGFDGDQIREESNKMDLASYFDGGKGSYTSAGEKLDQMMNIFDKDMLGMHPATGIVELFGDMMERYTGDADLTFLGLYQRYGTELAISVSNVSRQQMEYCHVNTTPNLPIKYAIRASMSLPILWTPMQLFGDEKYVDGGVFNNFPIKAFDGWFLSTDVGDSYLARCAATNPNVLEDDSEPYEIIKSLREGLGGSFAKPNLKTIGFRVGDHKTPDEAAYASFLQDLETTLMKADANVVDEDKDEIPYPDTKLAKKYLELKGKESDLLDNSGKYTVAYVEVYRWFLRHCKSLEGTGGAIGPPHSIDTQVLVDKVAQYPVNLDPQIFNCTTWEEVVRTQMDVEEKGYITRGDTVRFWGNLGIRHAYLKNRKPTPIHSVGKLVGELISSVLSVSEEGLLRNADNNKRICTLSSVYVSLLDLELEQGDRDFLYAKGRAQTIDWIKSRTVTEPATEKSASDESREKPDLDAAEEAAKLENAISAKGEAKRQSRQSRWVRRLTRPWTLLRKQSDDADR